MAAHASLTVLGCLVMAYGTPASLDDVEAYYTHIRRGRPPAPEQLAELVERYRSLGGTSPLRSITEAQAARIAAALGDGWRVELGMKHSAPFIEDGAAKLLAAGVDRIVGVVLAPHYGRGSVGEYAARVPEAEVVPSWHDLREYLDFLAGAVRDGLAGLPDDTTVLFTAHSLPERVLEGDRYVDELQASAAAVAERAGLDRWELAWQSAGRTPEPWRGPDVLEVLERLAGSTAGVLVCPQGFVADHLEVLYDLDDVAAARAAELGLAFARTRSLNDDATVLAALAARVAERAASLR